MRKQARPAPEDRGNSADDWLETLEEVKRQYQQYVEISGLYELPGVRKNETDDGHSSSPEYSLATKTFSDRE